MDLQFAAGCPSPSLSLATNEHVPNNVSHLASAHPGGEVVGIAATQSPSLEQAGPIGMEASLSPPPVAPSWSPVPVELSPPPHAASKRQSPAAILNLVRTSDLPALDVEFCRSAVSSE